MRALNYKLLLFSIFEIFAIGDHRNQEQALVTLRFLNLNLSKDGDLIQIVKRITWSYKIIFLCRHYLFSRPIVICLNNLPIEFIKTIFIMKYNCCIILVVKLISKISRAICSMKLISDTIKKEKCSRQQLRCKSNLSIYLRFNCKLDRAITFLWFTSLLQFSFLDQMSSSNDLLLDNTIYRHYHIYLLVLITDDIDHNF